MSMMKYQVLYSDILIQLYQIEPEGVVRIYAPVSNNEDDSGSKDEGGRPF